MPIASEIEPSASDIEILNLLRCEPPTIAFNFFEYGGLTRSVFGLLQDAGNLERIISGNSGHRIRIPSSSSKGKEYHELCYEKRDGLLVAIANAHNNFSKKFDAKFFGRTKVRDNSGRQLQATVLALEVYRKGENGNEHPIWELGVYVHEDGSKEALYGEEMIVEMPETAKRVELIGRFCEFISSLKGMTYDPMMVGFIHDTHNSRYLKSVINGIKGVAVISEEEFIRERAKWFRYLAGTLGVENVFKFEDYCGYKLGYRVYRVELTSTHLKLGPEGGYNILVLADTEGFPEADNIPKDANDKRIEFGPYLSHREALIRFLETANHYLKHIHINAGIITCPFTIDSDFSRRDFKYATIVKDSGSVPITVSSWETSYLEGRKLPLGQMHHYLQLWNNGLGHLRLEEGVDFEKGLHPKHFMGKLLRIIPQVGYGDGSNFLQKAREEGILLKPSD